MSIKKKKAFTLIELMAVVIILGIVSTITVVSINYTIQSSKNKLYVEQIERLTSSVRKWAVANTDSLPINESGIVFFSISRLKDEGIVDTEVVIDPRTNEELNGCVTIQYDNIYQQYEYLYEDTDCSEVEGAYLPVITVEGGETQYAEVNGYYEFPSATSVDYNGRSITVEGPIITESGTVVTSLDFSTVGDTYLLTYESIDTTLNITATKEITLIVRDTVSPVITFSDKEISHESGDPFTMPNVVVSDNSCGTSGIDTSVNGCAATLNPIVNSDGFSSVIPGTYTISYTATDSSGNIRVAVVNVVVADTLGPDLADLTFKLNNSSGAVYAGSWTKENIWVGDISAPDQGSGLREYRYYLTTSGDTCSTSYGSYTTLGNTTTDFTISSTHNGKLCFWAVDNVFNVSNIIDQTILIERTVPVCGTWTPTISPWKNSGGQSFTLSGSTDTGGSLINTAGGNCTTAASNNATCTVDISDNASNTVTCTSPVNRLETTLPTITYTNTSSSSSYYGGAVFTAITNPISVQDTTSGLVTFRYEWTGSATNPTGINSTTCTGGTEVTVTSGTTSAVVSTTSVGRPSTSGIHYLHVCAIDEATNVNKSSSAYYLDVTVPTVSANNASSSWFSSRTTTVSASDANSGLATVRYNWNTNNLNSDCTGGTATSNGAVLTVPEGSNRLYVCSKDNAGNTNLYDSTADQFRVDAVNPTVSASNASTSWFTSRTTTISASDALSGLAAVRYNWNTNNLNADCSGGTATSNGAVLTVPEGSNRLYVCSKDNAGNTNLYDSTADQFRVDTVNPLVSASNASSSWFTSRTTTISASDALSGLSTVRYNWNTNNLNSDCTGGTATSNGAVLTVPSGSNRLYVCSKDNAGNTNLYDSTADQFRVDTVNPLVSASNASTSWFTSRTTTISASDALSGLATVRYNWNTNNLNSDCTGGTATNNGAVLTVPEGSNRLYVCARDNAGNTNLYDSTADQFRVDTVNPLVSASNASSTWFTSRTTTVSASDALSGLSAVRYAWDTNNLNADCSGGTATSNGAVLTVSHGSHRLYLCSKDNAGNVATYDSGVDQFRVDTTAPTVTISYSNAYLATTSQSITFSASDSETGVPGSITIYRRSATLSNGSCGTYGAWSSLGTQVSPYTNTMTTANCYQYYASAANGLGVTGDSGQSPTNATKIDTTAPVLTWSRNGSTSPYRTSQCTVPTYYDNESGIATGTAFYVWSTSTGSIPGTYEMPSGTNRCYSTTSTTIRITGIVENNAGTSTRVYTNVFYVDSTAPTMPTPLCGKQYNSSLGNYEYYITIGTDANSSMYRARFSLLNSSGGTLIGTYSSDTKWGTGTTYVGRIRRMVPLTQSIDQLHFSGIDLFDSAWSSTATAWSEANANLFEPSNNSITCTTCTTSLCW
jgi:prepilin-type N-terminal cleavage/methylation domain-containing protein